MFLYPLFSNFCTYPDLENSKNGNPYFSRLLCVVCGYKMTQKLHLSPICTTKQAIAPGLLKADLKSRNAYARMKVPHSMIVLKQQHYNATVGFEDGPCTGQPHGITTHQDESIYL